jgi:hypothetical protein
MYDLLAALPPSQASNRLAAFTPQLAALAGHPPTEIAANRKKRAPVRHPGIEEMSPATAGAPSAPAMLPGGRVLPCEGHQHLAAGRGEHTGLKHAR